MAKAWYGYVDGNPLLPESYYLITVTPEFGPGVRLSAIYAKGVGIRPEPFSVKLMTHITNALTLGVSQHNKKNELIVSMNH